MPADDPISRRAFPEAVAAVAITPSLATRLEESVGGHFV